jgi:hypothetical protein
MINIYPQSSTGNLKTTILGEDRFLTFKSSDVGDVGVTKLLVPVTKAFTITPTDVIANGISKSLAIGGGSVTLSVKHYTTSTSAVSGDTFSTTFYPAGQINQSAPWFTFTNSSVSGFKVNSPLTGIPPVVKVQAYLRSNDASGSSNIAQSTTTLIPYPVCLLQGSLAFWPTASFEYTKSYSMFLGCTKTAGTITAKVAETSPQNSAHLSNILTTSRSTSFSTYSDLFNGAYTFQNSGYYYNAISVYSIVGGTYNNVTDKIYTYTVMWDNSDCTGNPIGVPLVDGTGLPLYSGYTGWTLGVQQFQPYVHGVRVYFKITTAAASGASGEGYKYFQYSRTSDGYNQYGGANILNISTGTVGTDPKALTVTDAVNPNLIFALQVQQYDASSWCIYAPTGLYGGALPCSVTISDDSTKEIVCDIPFNGYSSGYGANSRLTSAAIYTTMSPGVGIWLPKASILSSRAATGTSQINYQNANGVTPVINWLSNNPYITSTSMYFSEFSGSNYTNGTVYGSLTPLASYSAVSNLSVPATSYSIDTSFKTVATSAGWTVGNTTAVYPAVINGIFTMTNPVTYNVGDMITLEGLGTAAMITSGFYVGLPIKYV